MRSLPTIGLILLTGCAATSNQPFPYECAAQAMAYGWEPRVTCPTVNLAEQNDIDVMRIIICVNNKYEDGIPTEGSTDADILCE